MTDMALPRGNALRLPSGAKLLRAVRSLPVFRQKTQMGGSRLHTPVPETLQDSRWPAGKRSPAGFLGRLRGHPRTKLPQAVSSFSMPKSHMNTPATCSSPFSPSAVYSFRAGWHGDGAQAGALWPIFVELKSSAGVATRAQKQLREEKPRRVGGWHEAPAH